MIFDKLENLKLYIGEDLFNKISDALGKIHNKEQVINIDGDDVFIKVMSYSTSLRDKCEIEAHSKYIDIQSVLKGAEGVDIYKRNSLREKTEYDIEKDIVFFEDDVEKIISKVDVFEGDFIMIWPHEAHKPQVAVNNDPMPIIKFVIKINVNKFSYKLDGR